MRRLGALALLLMITACSGGTPVEGGAGRLDVLDAGSRDLEAWPWLPGSLPRRVPTDTGALPTVAADPPGQALLAVHVGERLDDPWEWAAEHVLVHGIDGRWRRLDLAGLRLPDGVPYVDSYGAGDLSPDGRWWVGRTREGVVLVDLGEGRAEVMELGRGGGAQVVWLPDSSGFRVQSRRPGRSDLVDLRTRAVESRSGGLGAAGPAATGPGAGAGRTVTETGSGEHRQVTAGDAVLRLDDRDQLISQLDGWLDPATLLMTSSTGLAAWRPEERRLYRVTQVEADAHALHPSASVAVAALAEAASRRPAPVVRLPEETRALTWLRSRLPRRLPGDAAALPSLADDPPGRATLVHHPAEGFDDPRGWGGETLLLHGADGEWRRLDLATLDLPEDAWPGPDTYGAGVLSPDGRRWTGPTREGVVVVDLGTGTHRLVEVDDDWWDQRRRRDRVAGGRDVVEHQPDPSSFLRVEAHVVERTTSTVEQVLRFDNRGYRVRGWSWLDPETVLLETDEGLLAWLPDRGLFRRVLAVPREGRDHYATTYVAAAP